MPVNPDTILNGKEDLNANVFEFQWVFLVQCKMIFYHTILHTQDALV